MAKALSANSERIGGVTSVDSASVPDKSVDTKIGALAGRPLGATVVLNPTLKP